jgi:hypothetical protein
MIISSRFIYFTCLHTSFLVQRDRTPWVWSKKFLHHMVIFYRYNFTHASPILCSKSLHLHLYFLGSYLYIYKWFYIFYFFILRLIFYSQTYIVPTPPGHHTIIFYTTNFI